MEEALILKLTAIGVLGMGAQWLAWRTQLPAIVLLSLAGILAGPVLGLLSPQQDFGPLLQPMIALAVAIILFEGGLNLNLREIRKAQVAVGRLIYVGVPLSWGMGTLAAHHVAGLSWGVAALLGGILVVTGPTVIMPMLRQARLAARPAALLKWEGIVNDPIGALLAVLVFQVLAVHGSGATALNVGWLLISAAFAVGLGFALARVVVLLFSRGFVPEHLKAATLLIVVVAGFEAANQLQRESGLLTVTALGVALANSRLANLDELRRFKENLTILLVSAVFVLLTASLQPSMLAAIADWRSILFVALMLFVVRPLNVWISTVASGLTWQERALVGWIAPRGVVAVAVAGFFQSSLLKLGYDDAERVVPLTFAIVFATVFAHGFSIRAVARRLGLSSKTPPGILIVGGSPWSSALGRALHDEGVPVTIADDAWGRLRPARQAGLPVHYGEILSEAAGFHLEFARFRDLLVVSDNDAYNAFVCIQLAPVFGHEHVFQLGQREEDEHESHGFAPGARGRTLLPSGAGFHEVSERHAAGWVFQKTRLSQGYDWQRYLADRPPGTETLLVIRPSGRVRFHRADARADAHSGDLVLSFAPPAPGVRPLAAAAPPGRRADDGRERGEKR